MPTSDIAAIDLPFEEAVDFFRQKARVPTQHWTDVWRTAHSHSFMVAGAASDALLADFQQSIQKALNSGTTLAEFRKDFDRIVEQHGWAYNGTPGWRSRIIYETNLSTAYSAGRYAQLTEPDTLAVYPYWQYVHSGSAHPRLQHLAWNGLTLRADDPFWSTHYPPNGWRCGCRVRPVSKGGLSRMGKAGPDTAPPVQTRTWRNPRTGETHQVPVGIDPGFDYNAGQAWKQGGGGIPVASDPMKQVPPARHPKPTPISQLPADERPREFSSIEDANAHWTDLSKGIFADWPEKARTALDAYKGSTGRTMNDALRNNTDPQMLQLAGYLSEALSKAVLPEPALIHRGIGEEELKLYVQSQVGEVVRQPGFVSGSLSKEVAAKVPKATVIEIRIPKGMPGALYVHPFPKFRFRQYEMLLNAGTMFRVVSNTADRVILEAVNERE